MAKSTKNIRGTQHRFLDEAGDSTFYGKGKKLIVGENGVSLSFMIGMLKIKEPLDGIRKQVEALQMQIANDVYFSDIPSIQKKKNTFGYYFHATDDLPEVRKIFYDFIKTLDCSFEVVVGRKEQTLFETQHNRKENEFYADLLSHLLKNRVGKPEKLILNIAERGNTTKNTTMQLALLKAEAQFIKKYPQKRLHSNVVFNVQNPLTEPLVNIADYLCWAVQRVFERGEVRYYNYVKEKISLVMDLYDTTNDNYYTLKNPLSAKNRLSPPLP